MTQSTTKPTHRLVRYYGEGKDAPRAEIGVVFAGEKGRMTVIVNTLEGQIRLNAFPTDSNRGAR